MLKQRYRTEIGIISDILGLIMDCGRSGMIISSIARRANLSHYTAIEKCQKLTDLGLMESTSNDKSRTFVIIDKGIQFFQQLQKFLNIIQEVKIRY